MKTLKESLKGFEKKDVASLAKLISAAENEDPEMLEVLSRIFPDTGRAFIVGITGPPGAGKSTLVNALVRFLRVKSQSVGVVAIDPVSPVSGGAILGDRIRLADHFNDPKVFIRSLSTRGKLGGLSLATRETLHLLDAFGFDTLIVETVGVGQSEVDVKNLVDVTVVVVVPESGDQIQTMKAGLLEVGDIYAVHKSDRDGAHRLLSEIETMLQIEEQRDTPVFSTHHNDPQSLERLFEGIQAFAAKETKKIETRRMNSNHEAIVELVERRIVREARGWVATKLGNGKNPYELVRRWNERYPFGTLFER